MRGGVAPHRVLAIVAAHGVAHPRCWRPGYLLDLLRDHRVHALAAGAGAEASSLAAVIPRDERALGGLEAHPLAIRGEPIGGDVEEPMRRVWKPAREDHQPRPRALGGLVDQAVRRRPRVPGAADSAVLVEVVELGRDGTDAACRHHDPVVSAAVAEFIFQVALPAVEVGIALGA